MNSASLNRIFDSLAPLIHLDLTGKVNKEILVLAVNAEAVLLLITALNSRVLIQIDSSGRLGIRAALEVLNLVVT